MKLSYFNTVTSINVMYILINILKYQNDKHRKWMTNIENNPKRGPTINKIITLSSTHQSGTIAGKYNGNFIKNK